MSARCICFTTVNWSHLLCLHIAFVRFLCIICTVLTCGTRTLTIAHTHTHTHSLTLSLSLSLSLSLPPSLLTPLPLPTNQPTRELCQRLRSITFDPLSIDVDGTLIATRAMFTDSGFAKKFRMRPDDLSAWLVCVKRSYRDVRYHNWKHAFNVGQFVYGVLMSSELGKYFTDLEKVGILIAALSHDLDHRGTNNTFEKKYSTPLGDLYSTSTLEHHHFDRAVTILSTEGQNILSALPSRQYEEAIRHIEAAILATDLGRHFATRKEYKELVDKSAFDGKKREHLVSSTIKGNSTWFCVWMCVWGGERGCVRLSFCEMTAVWRTLTNARAHMVVAVAAPPPPFFFPSRTFCARLL